MVRINGNRVETISAEEVQGLCRELWRAAEQLNAVRDGADKLAAAMEVFGRNASAALEAARTIEPPA